MINLFLSTVSGLIIGMCVLGGIMWVDYRREENQDVRQKVTEANKAVTASRAKLER